MSSRGAAALPRGLRPLAGGAAAARRGARSAAADSPVHLRRAASPPRAAPPAEEAPASQAQEGAAPAKKKRNNNPGVRVQVGAAGARLLCRCGQVQVPAAFVTQLHLATLVCLCAHQHSFAVSHPAGSPTRSN